MLLKMGEWSARSTEQFRMHGDGFLDVVALGGFVDILVVYPPVSMTGNLPAL